MPPSKAVPRFAYLGPVSSHLGDTTTTPPAEQQRTLLARLLAATGEPVRVADLQAELWGTTPPATANKAIQVLVGRLRRTIGCSEPGRVIRQETDSYCLDPATCLIDAREFRRHVRRGQLDGSFGRHDSAVRSIDAALSLWRGPAFEEYADRRWAQPERAALKACRAAAGIQRVESLLHLDRPAAALDQLDAELAAAPTMDRLHALRVWAIAELQSPTAAATECDRLGAELAQHAGTGPGPLLLAAVEHLEAGTRPVVMPARAPTSEPLPDAPPHGDALQSTAHELAAWLRTRGEQPVEELLRSFATADRDEVDVLDDLEALLAAGVVSRRLSGVGVALVWARSGRGA